ncbi:hypothetical protein M8J75_016635 [Diaphorina citri]|nr:hypothetical protein M8J75_016635 [Diaphorina citri]KAI5720822.1 hypothetical protein M8J77_012048 [Diaphorina citri]
MNAEIDQSTTTPTATPAATESMVAAATAEAPMQVDEDGGAQEEEATGTTPGVQHVASNLNRLHLDRPKLSGAQRRKALKQRAKERGESIPPRKQPSKVSKGPEGHNLPSVPVASTPRKRGRSALSTPSTGERVPQKKSKPTGSNVKAGGSGGLAADATTSGVTYSQATIGVKMAIVPIDYPKEKLSSDAALTLKRYIYEEVLKTPKGSTIPSFVRNGHEKGALVVICRDEFARNWLVDKVKGIPTALSIHVKVGNYRDIIIEHKAVFMVSTDTLAVLGKTEPKEIMSLVGFQNPTLDPDTMSIMSVQKDEKGLTLVVSLDDESLKEIQELGYKINLGLEMISIRVRGEKKANAIDAEADSDKPPT